MKDASQSPRLIRLRDVAACVAVLLAGLTMAWAIWTDGKPMAVNLMILGFGAAGALIVTAYSVGAIIDRIGRRFPVLVRPRHSMAMFIVATPLLAAGLAWLWMSRETLMGSLGQGAQQLLERLASLPVG